jgi:hypothetical protein
MSQKKLLISNAAEGLIDAIRNSQGTGSVLYDDTTDTLIATKFSGSGEGIYNASYNNLTNKPDLSIYALQTSLTASSITNFSTDVRKQFSAGSNITINNGVISSLAGGGGSSDMTFSNASASVSLYDVVAINSTGLVRADKSDLTRSNAFGVVSSIVGTDVVVKLSGEVTVKGASSYTISGSVMWLGSSGGVTDYSGIGSGNYATQIGFISNTGKLILMPRATYKLA